MASLGDNGKIERDRPVTTPDRKAVARRLRPTAGTGAPREPSVKPSRHRARAPEDFKTSTLNLRLKSDLKEQATATLERLGISLPEAVRVFLGRVVSEQSLPFRLEVPNAETAAALRESRSTEPKAFASAEDFFDALEKGAER